MIEVKKGMLGTLLGLFSYIVGSINLAVIVMFLFIVIDFITGILGNKAQGGKYDKKKAEQGLYKKLAMIIFWLVVVLIEIVLKQQGTAAGITLNTPIPTLVATFYILGTELLSVINNLNNMGFKVPKWFVNIGNNMTNVYKDESN